MSQQVKVYRELQFLGAGTGVHNLTVQTNQADALSIKDSAADIIVFGTTTNSPTVTITPATTISGATTLSSTLAVTGITTLATYLVLGKTDTDGATTAQLWYDTSENKLKFFNGTIVQTVTSTT